MSRRPPGAWIAAAALLASACAGRPPAAPPLNPVLDHRAGGALGEAPAALDPDPGAALALRIEWRWVPASPDDGLAPIGVHALTVTGSGGDLPFGATPLIVGAVRVALGDEAGLVARRLRALPSPPLAVQQTALPAGVAAVLAEGDLALELSRPGPGPEVQVAVARQGQVSLGAVRLADAPEEEVGDLGPDEDRSAAAERERAVPPVGWREVVLLDTPLVPGGPPAVIALPGGSADASLVVLIELSAAPAEAEPLARHGARLAQCLADVAASAERETRRAAGLDAAESKHRQLIAAARSMAQEGDRRRAAVFLSSECGASLALDVVLAADPEALDDLAASWRESVGPDTELLARGDALAWSLERATALWLAQRADGALPAELEAVLLRQTGVVGRAPGLLRQFVEESDGVASWREKLELENRLALEDNLPGSRVRAFDWLAARGLAPAGYDPLAPRAERQAALLAAEEAR